MQPNQMLPASAAGTARTISRDDLRAVFERVVVITRWQLVPEVAA